MAVVASVPAGQLARAVKRVVSKRVPGTIPSVAVPTLGRSVSTTIATRTVRTRPPTLPVTVAR